MVHIDPAMADSVCVAKNGRQYYLCPRCGARCLRPEGCARHPADKFSCSGCQKPIRKTKYGMCNDCGAERRNRAHNDKRAARKKAMKKFDPQALIDKISQDPDMLLKILEIIS
jgi:hypothetical protein